MATHTVSKQKSGVFTVDGEAFACQQRSIRVVPPATTDDAPEEVLDGTALESDDTETKAWKLIFTAVQDFTNDEGLQVFSWEHAGETVPYSWQPRGATGPTYAGSVVVSELEVGGEINRRLDVEAEWVLTGKPTRTPAA